jgi:hypothetical protein
LLETPSTDEVDPARGDGDGAIPLGVALISEAETDAHTDFGGAGEGKAAEQG